MRKYFYPLLWSLLLASLFGFVTKSGANSDTTTIDEHPSWIMQGNVYEVNVRQYTPEGTLKAFAKHLDRLKAMGVQTLWFMPINPISKLDRKGSLGSYYAVSDYTALNPEFGTMDDWKQVVKEIHAKGMKVIIDWVPNHTGADHRWLKERPEFFVKDSTGKPAVMFDWTDTRQLNYKNPAMQDSMIASMKYWISQSDIDGFRCDVAWNVPGSFWSKCIGQLRQMKSVFMLAEGDSAYLSKSGFDAVYPWQMFHVMEKIAQGKLPASSLDSIRLESEKKYTPNTLQLYFTSNHDENSWNKADYGTFAGDIHAPFAVFTQTMSKSVPLVYSGQEEPLLRALKFFDKDPIGFKNYQRAPFYTTLQKLRQSNKALSADASFTKIKAGDEKAVFSYLKEKGNKKILVVLNLSNQEQTVSITEPKALGTALNVFSGKKESLDGKPKALKAWGYWVYEY